jgi:peptidoglycan/xylan/chitin deacetylase (PgdA/CDA1 family)
MKFFKKAYYTAGTLLPTGFVKKLAPASTLLPYHHLVSDEDVLHVKHLYSYKNVKQFTNDLDYLLKYVRPVSVEEIVSTVKKNDPLPPNSFLLTFDDGFREVADVIEPILTAKGVPAIFFINPAFINNNELFYRCKISLVIEELLRTDRKSLVRECAAILGMEQTDDPKLVIDTVRKITNLNKNLLHELSVLLELSFEAYLKKHRPFLTDTQLIEMTRKGYTIGAHSWDHPYYHLISDEEQQRQTIDSCAYVLERYAPAFNSFSFPHSDARQPQAFFDRINSGPVKIDLFFGTQNQKPEPANNVLHRFNAERPELPMKQQLNGILILMMLQKMLKKRVNRA